MYLLRDRHGPGTNIKQHDSEDVAFRPVGTEHLGASKSICQNTPRWLQPLLHSILHGVRKHCFSLTLSTPLAALLGAHTMQLATWQVTICILPPFYLHPNHILSSPSTDIPPRNRRYLVFQIFKSWYQSINAPGFLCSTETFVDFGKQLNPCQIS